MSESPQPPTEPIPGYQLVQRLGSGGYGQVWKAVAPGGIEKAIKFIYGYHDEDRAARERRALNRIKEVRHPFLLSLDRIEVVEGQLVIVTELADKSLKDRFVECQRGGLGGIPRDELLVYLRDAADALDYMSEHCGLQHLDVKPENLLLVGGRVKVADFGLVRDVRHASVSIMGGLTPIYAPPEVFEGRPGMRSDQYSLAIVYQEMLTSVLPFPGASAAQLMAQHMQDRPDLTLLPPHDRPTIARGLSKSPDDRFPNCRTMVEQLLRHTGRRTGPKQAARNAASGTDDQRGHTVAVARPPSGTPTPPAATPVTPTIEVASVSVETVQESVQLPPLDASRVETRLRPTLFVGIGGVAGRVLRGLRERLDGRLGDLEQIPSLQMLLFDTDLKSILHATAGEGPAALAASQTVALPLRRIQEYRDDSSRFLRWLSRRWLYNIPRSLQPEGRRPLGRLAMVDHAEEIIRRLRSAIATMTSAASHEASARATGRPLETQPRIFVIASTAGGTGGGMVLDMAYAIRKVLADLGLSDAGVRGILLHATPRGQEAHDLAIANTCACLSELKHYSHPSLAYPGAPECGLPQSSESDATFPHTYLVDLGSELTEHALDRAADNVAEYLFLNAATPVGPLLDQCRDAEAEATGTSARLRSFGIAPLSSAIRAQASQTVETLCRRLLAQWAGTGEAAASGEAAPGDAAATPDVADGAISRHDAPSPPPSPDHLPALAAPLAERLDCDRLVGQLESLAWELLGIDPADWAQRTASAAAAGSVSSPEPDRPGDGPAGPADTASEKWLSRQLEGLLAPLHRTDRAGAAGTWHDRVERFEAELRAALDQAVEQLLYSDDAMLPGACRAADAQHRALRHVGDQVETIEARGRSNAAALHRHLRDTVAAHRTKRRRNTDAARQALEQEMVPLLVELARAHVAQIAARTVRRLARALAGHADRLQQSLNGLGRDLGRVAAQFEASTPVGAGLWETGPPTDPFTAWLASAIDERLPALATALRQRLEHEDLPPRGGLLGLFARGGSFGSELARMLRRAARPLVEAQLEELDLAGGLLECEVPPADDPRPRGGSALGRWLDAARPSLVTCGGALRLIVVAPPSADVPTLTHVIQQTTDQPCALVSDGTMDLAALYELQQLPHDRVVARLTSGRARYLELASRLHTRIDVDWTPLAAAELRPATSAV